MSGDTGECLPSDLLHHVYTFLVQCEFRKAAKALQKAAGKVSSKH